MKTAIARRVAVLVLTIHTVTHVQPGQSEAVARALSYPAGALQALAKEAERAAFKSGFKTCRACADARHKVNDAADGVRAVDGRTRPAQDFHALKVNGQRVWNKRDGRAIDVGSIA